MNSSSIEKNRQVKGRRVRPFGSDPDPEPRYELDWDDYYRHDVINAFLEELAENNEWAEVVTIGQSYEGRDGAQFQHEPKDTAPLDHIN